MWDFIDNGMWIFWYFLYGIMNRWYNFAEFKLRHLQDSSVTTKVELIDASAFCLLLTFMYAWPADYLQDAVSIYVR